METRSMNYPVFIIFSRKRQKETAIARGCLFEMKEIEREEPPLPSFPPQREKGKNKEYTQRVFHDNQYSRYHDEPEDCVNDHERKTEVSEDFKFISGKFSYRKLNQNKSIDLSIIQRGR